MNTLNRILYAGLSLHQITICFGEQILETKSILGQGEDITLKDGTNFIYDDSGNYILVYQKELDIYVTWELQNGRFYQID